MASFATSKHGLVSIPLHLLLCFSLFIFAESFPRLQLRRTVFDVTRYGAVPDGKTDNAKAFVLAWNASCRARGPTQVVIPRGTYMVGQVSFQGPCNGPILFLIQGTLVAPIDPSQFFTDTWIGFRYVEHLDLRGGRPGGILDGRGEAAWKYNDCHKNSQCRPLPVSLRLDFVKNSMVKNLRFINGKSTHMHLFMCSHVQITKSRFTAPADSPNTDGIRIGISNHIAISRTVIGTGDDCISLLAGSRDIDISGVTCGPGHGISVGSLGKVHQDFVDGVRVRNSTFIGTDNGVRVKTWAPSEYTMASNLFYDDLVMQNVRNPIVIDQQYCPSKTCAPANSMVQLSDLTFQNIRGTSTTKVALNLQCSKAQPCKNVKLENIHLAYTGPDGGAAQASCSNVLGVVYGIINPGGCI